MKTAELLDARKRIIPLAALATSVVLFAGFGSGISQAATTKLNDTRVVALQVQSDPEDPRALVMRGDAYAAGVDGPRDPKLAVEYYRKAAALDDPKGLIRLGEAMVLGRGITPDIEGGLMLISQAAESGDTNALILLGDFYARGISGLPSRPLAIPAYERAAELDRSVALVKLGDIYRDGRFVQKNPDKAVEYYRKAIAAGRSAALVPLGRGFAEGKLGKLGSPSDGVALLKQADDLGVPDAIIALSDCYLNGAGIPQNPQEAIDILNAALDKGNARAGQRLIAIYRDGYRSSIARDLSKAAGYLTRIEAKLDPASVQVEKLLLGAASASGPKTYGPLQEAFGSLPQTSWQSTIRKLRSVNPNAYIHMVQARLGGMGLYGGKASGRLSRETMQAIYKYCMGREVKSVCDRGPLSPGVTDVLSLIF
jgi:uncharacterized protein